MQDQRADIVQDETGQKAEAQVLYMSRSAALSAQAGNEMWVSRSAAGALVAGRDMQITNSSGNTLVAGGNIEITGGGGAVLVAGKSGIVSHGTVGVIISRQTVLGEGSQVLLDKPQAIAFGAALGAAFGVVSWLLGQLRAGRK